MAVLILEKPISPPKLSGDGIEEKTKPVLSIRSTNTSGHQKFVLVSMVLIFTFIVTAQFYFFDIRVQSAYTVSEKFWTYGTYLWLLTLPFAILGFIGLMWYRPPSFECASPINEKVWWRIATKGDNIEALIGTVRRIQLEMKESPLFRYHIEIVAPVEVLIPQPCDDVTVLVVPKGYKTPLGSRFKGRDLHWAIEQSRIEERDWIVHLDEESRPTLSLIRGLVKFIVAERKSSVPKIGQGAIVYHRQWKEHPLLTLADCARTGMDFAHYYLQMRLGIPLFGIHGSFVVIRNDVLKATGGMDIGERCSETEDAAWCLMVAAKGFRFGWVHGYLEEQSTQSVEDFRWQRYRWTRGLLKVIRYVDVSIRWRLVLAMSVGAWLMTPVVFLFSLGYFLFGYGLSIEVLLLANVIWAYYITLYMLGVSINMTEHGICRWKRPFWYVLTLVSYMPFLMMEISAFLCYFEEKNKSSGFHVIKK